ncbi:hypothetical protein B0O80DRAFT_91738 [Mortierella sp. GBAus27b]|nr:hypothetical protein B0O80DRAFT_91738 [Mortierella sp. GBAus27b]
MAQLRLYREAFRQAHLQEKTVNGSRYIQHTGSCLRNRYGDGYNRTTDTDLAVYLNGATLKPFKMARLGNERHRLSQCVGATMGWSNLVCAAVCRPRTPPNSVVLRLPSNFNTSELLHSNPVSRNEEGVSCGHCHKVNGWIPRKIGQQAVKQSLVQQVTEKQGKGLFGRTTHRHTSLTGHHVVSPRSTMMTSLVLSFLPVLF